MARKLRVEYEGAIYHLTVRSNGGESLFAGVGVSCQLRRLVELATTDKALKKTIEKMERQLDREQQQENR